MRISRRATVLAAIGASVLVVLVWFKLIIIPQVTIAEIYHNTMMDLGWETGAERR